MANEQVFQNIDAAKWQRIIASVQAKSGIAIGSDEGQDSAKGITISWLYNPASLELDITLVKESWYDPSAEEIDTDIQQWISAA